jgi:putative endopeptidase
MSRLTTAVRGLLLLPALAAALHAQGTQAARPRPPHDPRGDPRGDPRDTMTSFAVGGWGLALADRDTTVRPGDDFVRYAGGRWLDGVRRAGLDRNSSYWRDLMRLPSRRVAGLLRELGDDRSLAPNTIEGQAAAFYRAFVDTARIRRRGLAALEPALAAIRGARTHADLARVMGAEAGPWTPRPASVTVQTFPLALFALRVDQSPRDAARNAVFVGAAGLLLPAPSYYADSSQADIREAYEQYVAGMLRLLRWPEPERRARDVLALETRIAAASWTLEQQRDAAAQINPMRVAELRAFAPRFDWRGFLAGAGLGDVSDVVIDTKSAFPRLARIFADTPVEVWQARQAFAVADQDAPKLSDEAAALALDFRSRRFQGSAATQPGDMRVMLAADASIPDVVGALYAARYFSPQVRAATQDMARRIRDAFDARLAASPYLSDASKRRARAKLAAMQLDVGSPDAQRARRDYAELVLSDTDYFGNVRRARAFEWRRQVAALGGRFDRTAWPIEPHSANYAYVPTANVMEIAAAALEPPFFDLAADPAVNYGAIGTLMGAEMAAAFDRTGRRFGPGGELRDVFTPAEVARLDSLRDAVAAELSRREPVPGLHLQGALIADEVTDDVVGVRLALDAYHASLGGAEAPARDGTTGDQRFFLGRAQMWRAAFVPAFLRVLVATGHNTPPPLRINATAPHVDAWYTAFDVGPDAAMYVEPARRWRFLF